jgi:hypothetical protein
MSVLTSAAASIMHWQVSNSLVWVHGKKLTAFFASRVNNFLLFGKDCLVGKLRDVSTEICRSKHYALAST